MSSDYPSAAVPSYDRVPHGAWSGLVTGRDMATTAGVAAEPVRLSIDADGHFTLVHRQGTGEIRSEGTVLESGNRLTLQGRIVSPPSLAGAPVRHDLWRTERGLVGDADTFFLGHRVRTDLLLRPAA